NVVCEMCDFHRVRRDKGWKVRQMPELDPEVLRARLREEVPMRQVMFSGGGAEFFVHKRWPEIVEAARSRAREIAVITNGTAITEKVRERIVDLQMEVIRVSLHGATAKTAMEIMRGSQFEAVKENLSKLVRLRDERGVRYPRLHISFVGMKKNIAEFPDFVELAADLGADSVTLSSLMERPADGMEHTQGQSLVHDPDRLREIWRSASANASKRGISLLVNEPYRNLVEHVAEGVAVSHDDDFDDEPHSPVSRGETKLCLFPFEKPFVGLNGSVGLCCSTTGRDVEMGNADVSSFGAVWHGESYTALRRSLLTGENLPGFCAQCPRAPNVKPKTMELHAALLHARTTGRFTGIAIALRNLAHYRRYRRELAQLHMPHIRVMSIAKSVVRRLLGMGV
ncbi:MAG: radical SAM protein, partial [Myxococcales bacterium]|nr:radical SAM protein [Myxococcales bacterium]